MGSDIFVVSEAGLNIGDLICNCGNQTNQNKRDEACHDRGIGYEIIFQMIENGPPPTHTHARCIF